MKIILHTYTHTHTYPAATIKNLLRCYTPPFTEKYEDIWTRFSWFARFVKCFFRNYRKAFDNVSQRGCKLNVLESKRRIPMSTTERTLEENESYTCTLELITSNRDHETNFSANSNTIDVARACNDRMRWSEYFDEVVQHRGTTVSRCRLMQTDSTFVWKSPRGVKKTTEARRKGVGSEGGSSSKDRCGREELEEHFVELPRQQYVKGSTPFRDLPSFASVLRPPKIFRTYVWYISYLP